MEIKDIEKELDELRNKHEKLLSEMKIKKDRNSVLINDILIKLLNIRTNNYKE